MIFNDKIDFKGVFTIKTLDKDDNVIDVYTDKNLIMDNARKNMAELIGGVTSTTDSTVGRPINRFVLGTQGHTGTDILDYKRVVEYSTDPAGFHKERTALFSEENVSGTNYKIDFDISGNLDVTDTQAVGVMYTGPTKGAADAIKNTVQRIVSGRTVTYTITIPAENANSTQVLAYTEAALYTGGDIFSMKTFPARVKESSVKYVIVWSIIF